MNKSLLLALAMSACGGVVVPPGPDAGVECLQTECVIDGRCWAWEDKNPENECQLCHVRYSRTEWYVLDEKTACSAGTCHRVGSSGAVCQ